MRVTTDPVRILRQTIVATDFQTLQSTFAYTHARLDCKHSLHITQHYSNNALRSAFYPDQFNIGLIVDLAEAAAIAAYCYGEQLVRDLRFDGQDTIPCLLQQPEPVGFMRLEEGQRRPCHIVTVLIDKTPGSYGTVRTMYVGVPSHNLGQVLPKSLKPYEPLCLNAYYARFLTVEHLENLRQANGISPRVIRRAA